MMADPYAEFLAAKALVDPPTGIAAPVPLPEALFPFQRDIVRWALRRGRAALFAGTGLGKSLMELAWGEAVAQHTGRPVLLLTPLAVAAQMMREAEKFGLTARQVRDQGGVGPGVNVTNYQKLGHFDLSAFGGVVLDESSILKSHDGHYRTRLIEACRGVPFRLAATATPAPNDHMELGNHAEFLGVMRQTDMLACFFTHDGRDTKTWSMKGHAQGPFWRWMASWAVMLRSPADLGYDDRAHRLPPLRQVQHTVEVAYRPCVETGMLFPAEARTVTEKAAAKRGSLSDRVALAARITPADRPFVWWCHLNAESEGLARAIPGAVEIRGADSEAEKERKLVAFSEGRIRVLVTKPAIAGFGMNWQHCADTGFVGMNDSFEQVYQAVRRFWRFGQAQPVTVHFIAAETEGAVVANIRRKEADAERLAQAMVDHMADLSPATIRGATRDRAEYDPKLPMEVPQWLKAA